MKRHSIALIFLAALFAAPSVSHAGFFEISLGGSYSRSEYEGGSYSWSRRYGGSVGYNFSDSSTFEFSYQKAYERTHYENYQDSTLNDEVYSVNWVQNLASKQATFQPYFKAGVGQLVREAELKVVSGQGQVTELRSLTGVAALGMRIYLTKAFALRFEGTSYLVGGKLKTWRDNFAVSAGGSIFF